MQSYVFGHDSLCVLDVRRRNPTGEAYCGGFLFRLFFVICYRGRGRGSSFFYCIYEAAGRAIVGGRLDICILSLLVLAKYDSMPLAKHGRLLLISSRRILSSDLARCGSCVGDTRGSAGTARATVIMQIKGGVTTTARQCLHYGKLSSRVGRFT